MAITLTTGQVQSATDNLGKLMVDAAALISPSTAGLTTDLTTEITRIQALTDTLVEPTLGQAWYIEQQTAVQQGTPAGKLLTWLASLTYATLIGTFGPFYAWDALDYICSLSTTGGAQTGLSSFLTSNAILVDQYSADSFNAWVNATLAGSYIRRYGGLVPAKIVSASVFPHANVDTINTWTATGVSTGTLANGTATLSGAQTVGGNIAPGGGVVEAYAGNTIGAGSYTLTVTYVSIAGVAGQTFTVAVVGAATSGTVFVPTPNPGPTIASITSVAVTSGSANVNDLVKFRLKPVRAITA